MLGYAVKGSPKRVADILANVPADETWRPRIASILTQADLGAERAIFDLSLRQLQAAPSIESPDDFGYAARELSKTRPEWAAEYLGQYLRTRADTASARGFANPFDDDAKVFPTSLHLHEFIHSVCSTAPTAFIGHVWTQLSALITRTAVPREDMLARDPIGRMRHFDVRGDFDDDLLVGAELAFNRLATTRPEEFDALLAANAETNSETICLLLFKGFSANPNRYADSAIEFLLQDLRRLRVRASSRELAARPLLEAITPVASPEALERLATALLNFYPDLRGQTGRTQYLLLSGIAEGRRSDAVTGRLRELQRKFGAAEEPHGLMGGGFVESPIPKAAADKMSDEHWIGAVKRYSRGFRERQTERDFLKGGAEELARVLQELTRKSPGRFAALALKFQDDVNVSYFNAILRGVGEADPPLELEHTTALVLRCHALPNRPCGRWIARPVLPHAAKKLSPDLLAAIAWYATNDPDPQADHRSEYENQSFVNDGLNTVRGGIASEMAALIEANAGHVAPFDEAVRGLVKDPIAAVRAMAAETLLAISRHDKELSSSLFTELVGHAEDALLTTHYVHHYLRWSAVREFALRRPLLERMIRSASASVREDGAGHVTNVALLDDDAKDLADACFSSEDDALRLGVAKVYKDGLFEPEFRERCSAALKQLFDDASADVRETAGNAIWRMKGTELGEHVELARAFLNSRAFGENVNDIVHGLTETTAAVPQLILETAERLVAVLKEKVQGRIAHHAADCMTLVLRAYADTTERPVKERALDLIDEVLRLDLYNTNKLLAEHDRSLVPLS